MPQPIRDDSVSIDLRSRFQFTTVVTGSPALAAETIIATLTLPNFGDPAIMAGIQLEGWAAYTVGTSGSAVNLRIRQTNVGGTVVQNSGALTRAAASLQADSITGVDLTPGIGVYVMTMQVTAGAAVSTVSAVFFNATLI